MCMWICGVVDDVQSVVEPDFSVKFFLSGDQACFRVWVLFIVPRTPGREPVDLPHMGIGPAMIVFPRLGSACSCYLQLSWVSLWVVVAYVRPCAWLMQAVLSDGGNWPNTLHSVGEKRVPRPHANPCHLPPDCLLAPEAAPPNCSGLVTIGQRDGLELLPTWFDVVASRIAEFCLSALLFYLLAFMHLVVRATPLRRDAPRRNNLTLRCRSLFQGAPIRCAIFFTLCMLPPVPKLPRSSNS